MTRLRICLIAVLLCAAPMPALAVEPGEVLADPALEARARDISQGLRCLVCRNQSIDDSNAELARDLRVVLRERLSAGDSDDQAVAFLVDRYGKFILLKPPFQVGTLVLWFGPMVLLLVAGAGFAALWRRRPTGPDTAPEMSDSDRALLQSILNDKDPL